MDQNLNMQNSQLDSLQSLLEMYCEKGGLDRPSRLPTEPQHDGSVHIEIVMGKIDIVATERGYELSRLSGLTETEAIRELLFDLATANAQKLELEHRKLPENPRITSEGLQDDGYSRWNWMAPAIKTMQQMSPELGEYALSDYTSVLKRYPLEDYEKTNARYPLPD